MKILPSSFFLVEPFKDVKSQLIIICQTLALTNNKTKFNVIKKTVLMNLEYL